MTKFRKNFLPWILAALMGMFLGWLTVGLNDTKSTIIFGFFLFLAMPYLLALKWFDFNWFRKEAAYKMDLEDAVDQACHMIEFLHDCLTKPPEEGKNGGFVYAYPEQTLNEIKKMRELVPERPMCFHSKTMKGCSSCEERIARYKLREELNVFSD